MSIIQIDPTEVQGTGGQFIAMQGEVESLVSRARSIMNTLEGQFTGIRPGKIFGEWRDMQGSLTSAMETLGRAGTLLNRAAEDFSEADRR